MMVRLIGAGMILFSCGSFGFLISKSAKNEIITLKNFILAMEYMECELQYRMTPLPELCRATASVTKGKINKLFQMLSRELESQISPNVSMCMASALCSCREFSPRVKQLLEELGKKLGIFDLEGQLSMLRSLRKEAQHALKLCQEGYEIRSRSYKTIAICAGAAIVILLI